MLSSMHGDGLADIHAGGCQHQGSYHLQHGAAGRARGTDLVPALL